MFSVTANFKICKEWWRV